MDKQQLRQAHIDWSASEGFDVFATLKFRNGYDIGEQQAERILRIFLNKLDRTYFGKRQIRQRHTGREFSVGAAVQCLRSIRLHLAAPGLSRTQRKTLAATEQLLLAHLNEAHLVADVC